MSLLNFFQANNNKNIIYVLDRLLDFSVRDWKHKNIDFSLYKILNSENVYQEVVHMGVLPIIRENKAASAEFIAFINNLWMYMEYDVNTDYLWAKTTNDPDAQKRIQERIQSSRKQILEYLLAKKLIPNEVFETELNYKVKSLLD